MSPAIPFGEGFLLGIGLIVGIGPQNAFILHQSARRRFVLLSAVLASLIDGGLIFLGVAGVGGLVDHSPHFGAGLALAGAAFLLAYGWRSFGAALRAPRAVEPNPERASSRRAFVLTLLAVSLLNPSTYLDTLIVIGGSAARYSDAFVFAAGATVASVCWFFTLAFGAGRLGQALNRPPTARALDAFSGLVMWFIAARLLLGVWVGVWG